MPDAPSYAAIDLGASGGRIVRGRLVDGALAMEVVHRFSNGPVRTNDGLHWDLLRLLSEALDGLRRCGPLDSAGVDAWGVDYALLDEHGHMLGLPFHYRDARTNGMVELAGARLSPQRAYERTGIQTMPINTAFQLLAERDGPALAAAHSIALVPDLVAGWLTGRMANERTAASTTGLLDARTGEWARDVIDGLGLPSRPFGDLVDPGTALGAPLDGHGLELGTVRAVAGHDTASGFAAAPLVDREAAVLSSGTWSLLGVELQEPVLDDAAFGYNLTNERGIDGTTRLLKNVMGLWLEQECAHAWGVDHGELFALAEQADHDVALFDPDADELLAPGDMPARIAAACVAAGQREPGSRGELMRSVLTSLACKYRLVLERLEAVTGRSLQRIHVIGGGARVDLLCRLTADIAGREVLAGPVEATAAGNLLVQARAAGELGSLDDLRAVSAASTELVAYEPAGSEAAEATYHRFLSTTGLAQPSHA